MAPGDPLDYHAFLRRTSGAVDQATRHERKVRHAQSKRPKSRQANGFARTGPGRFEDTERQLERMVREGEGLEDPIVLRYAYLALREEWLTPYRPGPILTPFDADGGAAYEQSTREADMSDNGRRHWRISDICEQYDVSRPTLDSWRKLPGFPEPIIVSPPVWEAAAIEEWRAAQLDSERERRNRALEIADTGDLDEAARVTGVTTRTIRRWMAAREETT